MYKIIIILVVIQIAYYGMGMDEPIDTKPATAEKSEVLITSLPDNIQLIIGLKSLDYRPRVFAIHELSNDLPQDQVDALRQFLYQKLESQTLPDLEFNGLKNELVIELMKQQAPSPELAMDLVQMYQNHSYDETWRNYCVQFFGKCYPFLPDNDGRIKMIDAINAALEERSGKIAGTAGYMLRHMVDYPGFDRQEIMDKIFQTLNAENCSNGSKIMLLQAGAELGDSRILPIARQHMQSKIPLLQMSAIGAIGYLGDNTDLVELEKLAASNDLNKQTPAKSAIAKIKQRMTSK